MNTTSSICEDSNYKELFNTYSESLFRFLVYKYGDEVIANDVMQEAFIKLWTHCSSISPDKAKAFLYTVANHKMIDELRRQKRQLKHSNSLEHKVETNTPQYVLEEQEFEGRLNRVLNAMPEQYRIPFLLNRMEEKKYKEIAEILNISVKAVEKRMHKALQYLKHNLQIDKKIIKRR